MGLFVSVSPGTADNRRVVELFSYCMVELYVLFDLYGSGNRWELPSGCGSTYEYLMGWELPWSYLLHTRRMRAAL